MTKVLKLSSFLITLAIALTLSQEGLASSSQNCSLDGKKFDPKYATYRLSTSGEMYITLFAEIPKDDAQRKDACQPFPEFHIGKDRISRVVKVYAETPAKIGKADITYVIDDNKRPLNEFATGTSVELIDKSGVKQLKIKGNFTVGSCSVDLPVVTCK